MCIIPSEISKFGSSSAIAFVGKASSRAGPNMFQLWGNMGLPQVEMGNLTPSRIKQLQLSPCYCIREWPGYWPFYLLFL